MELLKQEFYKIKTDETLTAEGDEIEDEEHPKVIATPPTAQETVLTLQYLISNNCKSKYKWRHIGKF